MMISYFLFLLSSYSYLSVCFYYLIPLIRWRSTSSTFKSLEADFLNINLMTYFTKMIISTNNISYINIVNDSDNNDNQDYK